jgi:signal transduction histidine kinase
LGFSEGKFNERTLTNINEVLSRAVEQFENHPPPSVVNTKEVDLIVHPSNEPLICNIYVIPFIHAVRNIVANAYQAMENRSNGELRITTYMRRDGKRKTACLEISDTGKGIEKSKLSRIYDADFKERPGGNGLGLWLVRLSLFRMDAAISVSSKVNKGTTFKIDLPISEIN